MCASGTLRDHESDATDRPDDVNDMLLHMSTNAISNNGRLAKTLLCHTGTRSIELAVDRCEQYWE
jgi:hypothetical protein